MLNILLDETSCLSGLRRIKGDEEELVLLWRGKTECLFRDGACSTLDLSPFQAKVSLIEFCMNNSLVCGSLSLGGHNSVTAPDMELAAAGEIHA